MLASYSKLDKKLADLSQNLEGYLLSENVAFIQGLGQTMAETVFYGDTGRTPEKFMGLSPRYSAFGKDKTKSSYNVIDGGGKGSTNTSIWLLAWGDQTMMGLYPRGSKAGLSHNYKGVQTVYDEHGRPYDAYVTSFDWDLGLCVRDWRYGVRIANVDTAQLSKSGLSDYTGPDLIRLLTEAYHRLPDRTTGRLAIYCNSTVATALDHMVNNRATLALKAAEVEGKLVTSFRGIPIRECDALLDTEAAVPQDK